MRTTRTYDARGWVASVTHTASGGAVLASVSYVRSPSGEPTRVTREDGSYVTVTYDAALRVEREDYHDSSDTLVDSIAYTYDADGNRTTRTTSAGTESYVYASGSRLERVELGGATVADFTYDGGARVTRIQRGSQDLSVTYDAGDHAVAIEDTVSTVRREFDFDAEGRRTGRRRLVAGALAAALTMVTTPTMAANLDSPHLSFDTGTGVPSTGYVFDGEHALARYDAASTEPVYYLRDGMGSVIGVVDHAGTGSARIHYDGFGDIRSTDGALANLPDEGGPRFQGMWLEQDGLYYVRARNYDAQTGRFLSQDSARGRPRRAESHARFLFVEGNPYTARDPDGELTLGEVAIAPYVAALAVAAATLFAYHALVQEPTPFTVDPSEVPVLWLVVQELRLLNVLANSVDDGDEDDVDHMGDNGAQNRISWDAVRKIERLIGRQLSDPEIRILHDEITGQGLAFHEIVEVGLGCLRVPSARVGVVVGVVAGDGGSRGARSPIPRGGSR